MKKLLGLLVCLSLIIGLSVTANAALMVSLSDGSTTKIITDGTLADPLFLADPLSADGVVAFMGGLGNFFVNLTAGVSKPILGNTYKPIMDFGSLDISHIFPGSAPQTLTLMLTDIDFLTSSENFYLNSRIGGETDGIVSFRSYYDAGNTPFALTTLISDLGSFSSGAFSGSDSGELSLDPFSPYSLTLVAEITHYAGSQSSSFNAKVSPVPEPATMFLLGTGLIGLAGFSRRKLKKKK